MKNGQSVVQKQVNRAIFFNLTIDNSNTPTHGVEQLQPSSVAFQKTLQGDILSKGFISHAVFKDTRAFQYTCWAQMCTARLDVMFNCGWL